MGKGKSGKKKVSGKKKAKKLEVDFDAFDVDEGTDPVAPSDVVKQEEPSQSSTSTPTTELITTPTIEKVEPAKVETGKVSIFLYFLVKGLDKMEVVFENRPEIKPHLHWLDPHCLQVNVTIPAHEFIHFKLRNPGILFTSYENKFKFILV